MAEPVLAVEGLEAGYPGKQILFGVGFAIAPNEVVTLLGANGSGKSTVLKAIGGFVRPGGGTIRFEGGEIGGLGPHAVFRRGIAQVSQGRDLFPDMTVEQNLRLGAKVRGTDPDGSLLERCYAVFPRLGERRGQRVRLMSGGEQQMVAIARALMGRPRLLLLDEPSGGLAPLFVEEIGQAMLRLKAEGITMLLVEQNIRLALSVADRFLVLRDGVTAERSDIHPERRSEAEIVRSIYL